MDTLDTKVVYEQTGLNYRYFLDWRYKVIAGYLAILGALGVAYAKINSGGQRITLLLGAGVVSLVFWAFDFRNRELFWTCQNAAAAIEEQNNCHGSFAALNSLRFGTSHRLTHGFGINVLVASMLAAIVGTLWFPLRFWLSTNGHWTQAVATAAIFLLLVVFLELCGDRVRNRQERFLKSSKAPKSRVERSS